MKLFSVAQTIFSFVLFCSIVPENLARPGGKEGGCGCSGAPKGGPKNNNKVPKGAPQNGVRTVPSIMPNIFSIMRFAHDVIRSMQDEISKYLQENDYCAAELLWEDLADFLAIHLFMEEGNNDNITPKGLFKVIDQVNSTGFTQGNLNDHVDVIKVEKMFECAVTLCEDECVPLIQFVFDTFVERNKAHLLSEEAILQPNVAKIANKTDTMKTEILALVIKSDGFEEWVMTAMKYLEPQTTGSLSKATVFAEALYECRSDQKEWEKWLGWIADSVNSTTFESVLNAVGY